VQTLLYPPKQNHRTFTAPYRHLCLAQNSHDACRVKTYLQLILLIGVAQRQTLGLGYICSQSGLLSAISTASESLQQGCKGTGECFFAPPVCLLYQGLAHLVQACNRSSQRCMNCQQKGSAQKCCQKLFHVHLYLLPTCLTLYPCGWHACRHK